jgi:NADPH-dependent 2,4-dienoyl-CoA reductase/sulfur reductase-like enzyme
MSYDDAKKVSHGHPGFQVLFIGAGLIGLKAAEALEGKCAEMTIIGPGGPNSTSILDLEGSAIMQKHIESRGAKFILNHRSRNLTGIGPSSKRRDPRL